MSKKKHTDSMVQAIIDVYESMTSGFDRHRLADDEHLMDASTYLRPPLLDDGEFTTDDMTNQPSWVEDYERFFFEPKATEKTMFDAVLWVIVAAIVAIVIFGGLLLLFVR